LPFEARNGVPEGGPLATVLEQKMCLSLLTCGLIVLDERRGKGREDGEFDENIGLKKKARW
jgi:hypothetical protein